MTKRTLKLREQDRAVEATRLGLFRKARLAVRNTLATLPEVVAVLWSTTDEGVHLVTILSDRSDEAILRVAEKEWDLMGEMHQLCFDFRTALVDDLDAYLAEGYVPVIEKQDDDNSRTA